jgi:hypothetical protein
MRLLRIITSLLVLVPFLFSVSGILVIHSHCSCTGKNQVTFYLPPENCSDILDDHNHLFNFHASDLHQCCEHEDNHIGCNHEDGCDGCGCESPDAQFFKLKNQFTEEKISQIQSLIVKDLPETLLFNLKQEPYTLSGINIVWLKDPPPKLSEHSLFLHFICQTKIPHIA